MSWRLRVVKRRDNKLEQRLQLPYDQQAVIRQTIATARAAQLQLELQQIDVPDEIQALLIRIQADVALLADPLGFLVSEPTEDE